MGYETIESFFARGGKITAVSEIVVKKEVQFKKWDTHSSRSENSAIKVYSKTKGGQTSRGTKFMSGNKRI